jgi:hypothetical protein
LQDVAAAADNVTNVNDEDGVTVPLITPNAPSVQMTVRATNNTQTPATFNCWIDFNQNGDFLDTGEMQTTPTTVSAGSGSQDYLVTFTGYVTPITPGQTYIRCRIANDANEVNAPTGPAATGEVEDYRTDTVLAVTLASFDAASQPDHVLVTWETVSEASNSGFNLYRSLTADGEYTLLGYTPSAAPGSTAGAAYSFQDFDVAASQVYWYKLEDIDLSGAATMHAPVSVVFQAPTAVTLSAMDADAGAAKESSMLWMAVLAILALIATATTVVIRRRVTA